MKKSFLIKCAILMVIVSFTFISCSKEMIENHEVESAQLSQFEKDRQIISSMGYNTDEMREFPEGYLVEDYTYLRKDALSKPVTKHSQWGGYIVNANRTYTVGVTSDFASNSNHSKWIDAIKSAIVEYNNVPGCKLKLEYVVNKSVADILIHSYYGKPDTIGYCERPPVSPDKPGGWLYLNSYFDNELEFIKKIYTVEHEIGHALGLDHIGGWNYIPGTPIQDDGSIMQTGMNSWKGFSDGDIRTFQILWPLPPSDVRISINGGFYSSNPSFSASGDLARVAKYEWAVNGSTSISQSGNTVYVSTYPECTYLNVILTITDTQGRKATFSRGFSRY